jgi:hypothetical protein
MENQPGLGHSGGKKIRLSILPTTTEGHIDYPDLPTEEKTFDEIWTNLNDSELAEATWNQIKFHFRAVGDELEKTQEELAAAKLQIDRLNAQPEATSMMEDLARLEMTIVEKDSDLLARDADIATLNHRIDNLNDQLDANPGLVVLQQQIHQLTTERDQMALALARSQIGPNRNLVERPATAKSGNIADPKPLSDGKNPRFEDWLMAMERKLTTNADRYPTEYDKLTYISSRCEDRAQRTIFSRMKPDSVSPYHTAEECFDHLRVAFADPNRELKAQRQYRDLKMFGKASFSEFVSEFSILAQEANIDPAHFKRDFNEALTYRLRSAVVTYYIDRNVDFDQFVLYCHQLDDSHTAIDEDRKRNKEGPATGGNTKNTKGAISKATTSSTTTVDRASTPTTPRTFSPLTDEERDRYRTEGRCFYCRELGHIGKDCPKRAARAATAALHALERSQGTTNELEKESA